MFYVFHGVSAGGKGCNGKCFMYSREYQPVVREVMVNVLCIPGSISRWSSKGIPGKLYKHRGKGSNGKCFMYAMEYQPEVREVMVNVLLFQGVSAGGKGSNGKCFMYSREYQPVVV